MACACSGSDEGSSTRASPLIAPPDAAAQPDGGASTNPGPPRDAAADAPAARPSLPAAALEADPPAFQLSAAPGSGRLIAAGDSSPWLVGFDRNIYHYNNDSPAPRRWVPEPNTPQSSAGTLGIAVSPGGTPWKIDSSGYVWERSGPGSWVQHGTLQAYEIAVDRANNAWAISRSCSGSSPYVDCTIYRWTGSSWGLMSGLAEHVAVAPDGSAYVSNSNGTIYKWVGSGWSPFVGGGCAQSLAYGGQLGVPTFAAAPNDSLWVIGCTPGTLNDTIWGYSTNAGQWQQVPGQSYTISVSADGTPWVIDGVSWNIYEWTSSWTSLGPNGFSFYYNGSLLTWSGEVHDVAVSAGGGEIIAGATAGGVWQGLYGLSFNWFPIGDVGGGVTAQGQTPPAGPNMSIGTVAIKPNDATTVIVGTGASGKVNNSTNGIGNGIWYTHTATTYPTTWRQAWCDGYGNSCPSPVVKIRYSADSSTIFAATAYHLYIGSEDGAGNINFISADPTCQPGYQFTDLVTEPNSSTTFYAGVAHVGVLQSTNGGASCTSSVPGPLYSGGGASSITNVALAIASTQPSRFFASVAGPCIYGNDPQQCNDFQGIFELTAWPNSWRTMVTADPLGYPGLRSQGGHDWALATDPTNGTTILAGGVGLWQFSGCGLFSNCQGAVQASIGHGDYHAVVWAGSRVYAVSDGGLFFSDDGGATLNATLNTLGVANEVSVAVSPSFTYASAWDVGAHYAGSNGAWFGATSGSVNISLDGHQVLVDPANPTNGYECQNKLSGSATRFSFNGTTWTPIDSAPIGSDLGPCNLAKGYYSSLFTIYGTTVYRSFDNGTSWLQYLPSFSTAPWSILATNEYYPSVYVTLSGVPALQVSPNGGAWQATALPPGWPSGYRIGGNGQSIEAGSTVAIDGATNDLYLVGTNGSSSGALVYMSPAATHGASWNPLTGTGVLQFNQGEVVNSLAVDSAARSVIVATEGTATSPRPGAGIWRLNNPDVVESTFGTATHHWRPWVQGLPNATQPVEWLTGQYENGVYYYYAGTWGRGVWKREARGGDF